MRTIVHQHQQQKAQGMVEFALVLPLLLLMILAIFAFGHFLFVYITTVSASREAVRYGAALGLSENGIARFQDCKAIRAAARRVGSIAGISTITVQFDDGTNLIETCTGDTLANPANVGLGDRIVVQVTTNYVPIVPIVKLPSFPIQSRSVRTIYRDLTVGNSEAAQPVNTGSKTNTTLTITSDNPDYSKVGAAVAVYYSLSPSSGSPLPSGNVTVTGVNGANTISCTDSVAAGFCSLTPNAPGAWVFTAVYGGDTNFNSSSDTENHQVYYFTTVSITNQNPSSTILGAATNVVATYAIATDPAVTGSEKPINLKISADGTLICDIANPAWTGTCTLPAFTTAGSHTITVALPAGDPNFLEASGSATHTVAGGLATTTVITSIVNTNTAKTGFTVGDDARVSVQVTSAGGPSKIPPGTVKITSLVGVFCTVTLAADGTGNCVGTLTTRGTTGVVDFTAAYQPSGIYEASTSSPSTIVVDKAVPTIVLLGHAPNPSGVKSAVPITVKVSPVSGTIVVTGTVHVSVVGEALTCDATLGSNGEGTCSITFTTTGLKSLRLEYQGDAVFQPVAADFTNVHTVSSCPTLVTPRWVDYVKNKTDNQMIVQLSNPNNVTYQLVEVNASWPALAQTLYVTELQYGPSGQDATDWSCATNGNKHPPYCLWEKSAGLTTYYSTAASGQACQGTGGVCENWFSPTVTYADMTLGPVVGATPTTNDVYFVLSYAAPRYYSYQVKVRLINLTNPSDESCKWVTADFPRP
jgi:Flp pilus assembly protein TadG